MKKVFFVLSILAMVFICSCEAKFIEISEQTMESYFADKATLNQLTQEGYVDYRIARYFACAKENIIPIRLEQTLESFFKFYGKTFKINDLDKPHRPDFYILKKDVFVDVKAQNKEISEIEGCFFKFYKNMLEAYEEFKKYTNKKIYFACYHTYNPSEEESEYRDLDEHSLMMIDLDSINGKNKNIIENKNCYLVKREAFSTGLELLLK